MAAFCIINTPVFADGMSPQAMEVTPNNTTMMLQTREAFVRRITGEVLSVVHNPSSTLSAKKARLEQTFLQVVDLGWIAQFVIGKSWDSATVQQRNQYVSLYGKYLTGMYLAGLDEQSQDNLRDIKILGMEDTFEDAFLVHTQMVMAQGNNVAVDYMVREENGQDKIVDIVLEGVSMLRSHRSELGGLASTKGMDGVVAALQSKVNNPVTHIPLSFGNLTNF